LWNELTLIHNDLAMRAKGTKGTKDQTGPRVTSVLRVFKSLEEGRHLG
jgi:hypothetical protein